MNFNSTQWLVWLHREAQPVDCRAQNRRFFLCGFVCVLITIIIRSGPQTYNNTIRQKKRTNRCCCRSDPWSVGSERKKNREKKQPPCVVVGIFKRSAYYVHTTEDTYKASQLNLAKLQNEPPQLRKPYPLAVTKRPKGQHATYTMVKRHPAVFVNTILWFGIKT